MKQFGNKIWWLILIYLAVGYLFPVILRQRFMIVVLFVSTMLILSGLSLKEKSRFTAVVAIAAAFFLKIIPSPYPVLADTGLPMAINLFLTMLVVFLSCILAARISDIVLLRIQRTEK